MEAYDNTLTNVRFNITGVPYIILLQNNTIYELDLFPNYDNLKNFLNTNFSEVTDELKPLPKKVKFHYVAWLIFKQTLESITGGFNNFLKKKGIKITFNPFVFIFTVLAVIILLCTGCVKCCVYCCCNDDDIAKELKILEEQYKLEKEKKKKERAEKGEEGQEEEEEEVEGEEVEGKEGEEEGEEFEEEEDDEEEDEQKKKELTEEEKKKIEEEKKRLEEQKKEEERKKKEEEESKNNAKQKKKKNKKKKD